MGKVGDCGLKTATHCHADLGGEFADAPVAERAETAPGLEEVCFWDDRNVVGERYGIGLQTGLASLEEDVNGRDFMDTCA